MCVVGPHLWRTRGGTANPGKCGTYKRLRVQVLILRKVGGTSAAANAYSRPELSPPMLAHVGGHACSRLCVCRRLRCQRQYWLMLAAVRTGAEACLPSGFFLFVAIYQYRVTAVTRLDMDTA